MGDGCGACRVGAEEEKDTKVENSKLLFVGVQVSNVAEMFLNHGTATSRLVKQMPCQASLVKTLIHTEYFLRNFCGLFHINSLLLCRLADLMLGNVLREITRLKMPVPCVSKELIDFVFHGPVVGRD